MQQEQDFDCVSSVSKIPPLCQRKGKGESGQLVMGHFPSYKDSRTPPKRNFLEKVKVCSAKEIKGQNN